MDCFVILAGIFILSHFEASGFSQIQRELLHSFSPCTIRLIWQENSNKANLEIQPTLEFYGKLACPFILESKSLGSEEQLTRTKFQKTMQLNLKFVQCYAVLIFQHYLLLRLPWQQFQPFQLNLRDIILFLIYHRREDPTAIIFITGLTDGIATNIFFSFIDISKYSNFAIFVKKKFLMRIFDFSIFLPPAHSISDWIRLTKLNVWLLLLLR